MHLSIQMKVSPEKDGMYQLSSRAVNTVISKSNPIKIGDYKLTFIIFRTHN